MQRLIAAAVLLAGLTACAGFDPASGVFIQQVPGPDRIADTERRQAELANATFGTTNDHGQGVPLSVPMAAPTALAPDTVIGDEELPAPRVSPDAPTNAEVAAFNRQTNAMMQAAEAPLPDSMTTPAASETISATPLARTTDTTDVAAFALATTHNVGEAQYTRRDSGQPDPGTACARYGSPDEAQRAFLAVGGPEGDPLGLDPDGDGFACDWSPEPFRAMVGD